MPQSKGRKRDYMRERHQRDPLLRRENHLQNTYGIGLAEYDSMVEMQNGSCAICMRPQEEVQVGRIKRLSVDHCHETGLVRGLLCSNCNLGLGKFQDDPDRLDRAANYLRSTMNA